MSASGTSILLVLLFVKNSDINMLVSLYEFNPWWRTGKVPPVLVGIKRPVFSYALDYLPTRQMLVLTGLRRIGKTTLLNQLIDYLLQTEQVNPYHILYFSFDEQSLTLGEILDH